MKSRLTLVLAFIMLMLGSTYGQRNCGSMDHLHHQIEHNPERAKALEAIERHTQQYVKNNSGSRNLLVTIPVVVHVVYNSSTENISTAQVQSQIQVLNDDFRRLNSDADNTWPQAADVEIEFCLATVDPNGNSTTGITRTSTSKTSFGTNDEVKFSSSGGKDAWPASDYLNMWVCDISGSILGYAQFPGGPAATDGVVMDYQYFGNTGTATAPFDLGRTATHEVGHWLNLRHIWGDGGCGVDDFVSDTPESDAPNYGCTASHSSCGSTDMVQNYMDYSNDACMNLFTQGQKSRMQALFSAGGAKASLLNSSGCGSGNPPPPPPSCSDNEIAVTINFDNYPEETSWAITNSSGTTVASGGTYASQADGSTLTIDECLPDGCYSFTINDSYGDGICCSYGNGSYSVSGGGTTYASGASFGSSESTDFCLGNSGPTPTCDDGIQNGSETGIDCGGTDCDACPTCSDGVQNGNETGVDCGGPDCDACPTCSDGVQNGDETGVDCGGTNCSPCGGGSGSNVLHQGFFESGLDGWIDGGSDCYRYRGSRSYEGQYSMRIRDNSGVYSSMTSPAFDLAGYSTVEVEFYFYSYSMENGEDFWLRYNDGSGWQTVATYARGSSFENNSFYTATVTLDAASYNLNNGARFRFQCDASANADHIYIDQITITGSYGTRSSGQSPSLVGSQIDVEPIEADLTITPNPTSGIFDYQLSTEDVIKKVQIIDISGRVVADFSDQVATKLDISSLINGVYILSVETEEEILTQKLIKL